MSKSVSSKIPVIYQDNYLIVVDKPVDLPVHKNDFMPKDADYLTKIVGDITGKWIYNVHRLDAKTSGVIILALDSDMAKKLSLKFEHKEIKKTYNAIVLGNPGNGDYNRKVLVKKKSKFKKTALTNFKTLKTVQTKISYKDKENVVLSLMEIQPETGRWHQIRQHFAQHRHDILGDSHHGDFTLNKIVTQITGIRRLFLHAAKLEFEHPVTGKFLSLESKIPEDFNTIVDFDWSQTYLKFQQ